MLKIAFIAHGLGNGGAERVASVVASKLSERGYNVLYLSVYSNIVTYELATDVEYKYLNIKEGNKLKKFIRRSRDILRILDKFQPDIVISFITQEMLWTAIKGKYKIVYSERTDPAAKSKKLRLVTEWVYKRAYRVVFQTVGAKDYFDEDIQKKSRVIPNPINVKLPYWDIDNHEKIIIAACRIAPEKNLEMLIKAFAKFYDQHRSYILRIYGEASHLEVKEELIRLSEELGIRERVEYPGYSSNIYQEMAHAEIFVLTSNYEGLSNSMLEALCIGVPTICTDCPSGGAAMFIRDGKNGFLVGVNDSDALYQKMNVLADNIELQTKMTKASTKLRMELDADIIIDQWIEAIQ